MGPISSLDCSSLRNGSFAGVCCSWEKPSFMYVTLFAVPLPMTREANGLALSFDTPVEMRCLVIVSRDDRGCGA